MGRRVRCWRQLGVGTRERTKRGDAVPTSQIEKKLLSQWSDLVCPLRLPSRWQRLLFVFFSFLHNLLLNAHNPARTLMKGRSACKGRVREWRVTISIIFGSWHETISCTFISCYGHMHNSWGQHRLVFRTRKKFIKYRRGRHMSVSLRHGIILRKSDIVDRNDSIRLAAVSALLAAWEHSMTAWGGTPSTDWCSLEGIGGGALAERFLGPGTEDGFLFCSKLLL